MRVALLIVGGVLTVDVVVLGWLLLGGFIGERRWRKMAKLWLEVPPNTPVEGLMPALLILSQQYQGSMALVVVPEGQRDTEGKRLTLGWGFKPCGELLAALREFGDVTIAAS